jgi:hypothetical protein
VLSVAEKLPPAVAEAIANSGTCGCEVFGAAGRRQCIQNCLTASYHLAPFETLARDRTRNPLHASTQSSSLPPQPLLAAAFEPGRTFSTTSARRQQQQTRQNQRPERYLRQQAFETLAHDRTRNPLHASTQSSSLPPQPLLAAAFQAGRTFSTLPTRRQQQQTRQNQRPERYLRQHAFETLAHDRTRNPLHASTQSSSLPPQPLLAAAFQPR